MLSPVLSQMSTRLATRSARGDTECPEPHHHDRARDQAPAAGDGKADRKREDINPFRRHVPTRCAEVILHMVQRGAPQHLTSNATKLDTFGG
jgi:hypothetical protein